MWRTYQSYVDYKINYKEKGIYVQYPDFLVTSVKKTIKIEKKTIKIEKKRPKLKYVGCQHFWKQNMKNFQNFFSSPKKNLVFELPKIKCYSRSYMSKTHVSWCSTWVFEKKIEFLCVFLKKYQIFMKTCVFEKKTRIC